MLFGIRHLGKILGYFFSSIKVPPLAAWMSRFAWDVQTSDGDSGNFEKKTGRTISLQCNQGPWLQDLMQQKNKPHVRSRQQE
jgi:hypothetical protein